MRALQHDLSGALFVIATSISFNGLLRYARNDKKAGILRQAQYKFQAD